MSEGGSTDAPAIYRTLNSIEALAEANDWVSALESQAGLADAGRRELSTAANQKPWRDFIEHAARLGRSLRVSHLAGCHTDLANLRNDLRQAIGPEVE
jgi:hypothetical protein